jgi:tRNA pseudouridine55 synthase
MSRRRKGRDVHGIVLLDKPAGYSSNQAVQKVRWLFQARKAGHTGSLDPFATGMLPICLGEASKTAGFMLNASKTYVALAVLGRATATGDIEGEVIREEPVPSLEPTGIRSVLAGFEGQIRQVPPMYSALKHQGQPLYRLARAGREVPREAREVTIHSLQLIRWEAPGLAFRVHCSKGTYVRTLAEDIAQQLGSCAHLQALRRLDVEPFQEEGMIGLEQLEAMAESGSLDDCLLPPDAGLQAWPVVHLEEAGARRFGHGNPVAEIEAPEGQVRVCGPRGMLLGLGEVTGDSNLRVIRLLNLDSGGSE